MTNLVRAVRVARRLTQQDLAEFTGVSRQTISALELGKYVPSTVLALRISDVLGKSVNELFALDEAEKA